MKNIKIIDPELRENKPVEVEESRKTEISIDFIKSLIISAIAGALAAYLLSIGFKLMPLNTEEDIKGLLIGTKLGIGLLTSGFVLDNIIESEGFQRKRLNSDK